MPNVTKKCQSKFHSRFPLIIFLGDLLLETNITKKVKYLDKLMDLVRDQRRTFKKFFEWCQRENLTYTHQNQRLRIIKSITPN